MSRRNTLPALPPEYAFYSRYASEVDAILEDQRREISIGESDRKLAGIVYNRADKSVRDLLFEIGSCVTGEISGMVHIEPTKRDPEDWEVWGRIYKKGPGPRKYLGWIGLFVGYGEWAPKRLLGLIHPKGARREALKSFAGECRLKLASEKYEWSKAEECAIWLDKGLTGTTSVEEIKSEVQQEIKRLFKKITSSLTRIAEQN
jgi:hypothetical protein